MDIVGEVQQFHNYLQSRFQGKKTDFTHAELYDIIVQDKIRSVFPNLDIALRIFLTFMLTKKSNISAERSFSQLKRVKNPYRTTMGQEILDSLSQLCIEADMLSSVIIIIIIIKNEKIKVTLCENAAGVLYIVNKMTSMM